jgi:hypothetical protein
MFWAIPFVMQARVAVAVEACGVMRMVVVPVVVACWRMTRCSG